MVLAMPQGFIPLRTRLTLYYLTLRDGATE